MQGVGSWLGWIDPSFQSGAPGRERQVKMLPRRTTFLLIGQVRVYCWERHTYMLNVASEQGDTATVE